MSERHILSRDTELQILRSAINGTHAGRGSTVVITGEQGIGKTALTDQAIVEASYRGVASLVARAETSGSQSPYGLWARILDHGAIRSPDVTTILDRLQPGTVDTPGMLDARQIPTGIVRAVVAFATTSPALIVLDDLHLADRPSLDVLVDLARQISVHPILIVANYRDDLPHQTSPLGEYLPTILRIPDIIRLPLRRLSASALGEMIADSYMLSPRDQRRLHTYLVEQSEGNPLVAREILHELEADGVLVRDQEQSWVLAALPARVNPPVVHELVSRRLRHLEDVERQVMGVAAVIGQDVDLDLWSTVAEIGDDDLATIIEQATRDQLLVERGEGYAFRHPSLRKALYDGVVLPRRRRLHRRVGELLAQRRTADPHVVAHHFEHARDPRAVEWLVRAGRHAERSDAWLIAAERYEAAIDVMSDLDADGAEIAAILYRLALVIRYADPTMALTWLDEAQREAQAAGVAGLAAGITHHRGLLHCWTGEIETGLLEMEQAVDAIGELDDVAYADLTRIVHFGNRDNGEHRGTLIDWYSDVGRFRDVLAVRDTAMYGPIPPHAASDLVRISPAGDLLSGVAGALAHTGRYKDAANIYGRAQRFFAELGHHHAVSWMFLEELQYVAIPYLTDQRDHLNSLASSAVRSWERSSSALYSAYPQLATLPLLYLRGEWDELRTLGRLARSARPGHESFLDPRPILARVALHTGDRVSLRTLIAEMLPDGDMTTPGSVPFLDAVEAQRLSTVAALEDGDLDRADHWIRIHGEWVRWSGADMLEPGVALLQARRDRQFADFDDARHHASVALQQAAALGLQLDMLAAHRELGEIALESGDIDAAEDHLSEALDLGTRFDAPCERALTLRPMLRLRLAQSRTDESRAIADDARAIATRLGATPLIESIHAAITSSSGRGESGEDFDASPLIHLSPRELQILQRLVRGETTREIAVGLDISPRTAERHISNIYLKLDVTQRSQAISIALRHGIT